MARATITQDPDTGRWDAVFAGLDGYPARLQRPIRGCADVGLACELAQTRIDAYAAGEMPPAEWIQYPHSGHMDIETARRRGHECAVDA